MLRHHLTILCTVLTVISGAAGPASAQDRTTAFEQAQLKFDPTLGDFSYPNSQPVAVGAWLRLPVVTRFVEITGDGHVDYASGDSVRLCQLPIENPFEDIATRSVDSKESTHEGRGLAPVTVIDFVERSGQRFAMIWLAPVTVDSAAQAWFHGEIRLTVDGRTVAPHELLDRLPAELPPIEKSVGVARAMSAQPPTYLIITSAALKPAFDSLAAYRTSLGQVAVVETVDDVYGSFVGRDDAERIRERIRRFWQDGGEYVVLGGDENHVPVRLAYHNTTSQPPSPVDQQLADLYFADLDGDWDFDGDNVWGERYVDSADFSAEIRVGRVALRTREQVSAYVDKLILYETDPGNGEAAYLNRSFFFCSDQMRDYYGTGQHQHLAQAFPGGWILDTTTGVEQASGSDDAPNNLPAEQVAPVLSEGFGIVNILAHGYPAGFEVRTSGYNGLPKSRFTTDSLAGEDIATALVPNGRVGLYYSVGCDNGAFDSEQDYLATNGPNLAEVLLGAVDAGAVAFIGNSRHGWVGSSYLLERSFLDSLFAHPGEPAIDALYAMKQAMGYYRDQVLGLNFLGDPALVVYTDAPRRLTVETEIQGSDLVVIVRSSGAPVPGARVAVSRDGELLATALTGGDGLVTIESAVTGTGGLRVGVSAANAISRLVNLSPELATDTDDDITGPGILPEQFSLAQNYPNPFNPSTVIRFSLPASAHTSLTVYNILGQSVATLVDGPMPAGEHEVVWSAADQSGAEVASGVYIYRLEADNHVTSKKMMLVR